MCNRPRVQVVLHTKVMENKSVNLPGCLAATSLLGAVAIYGLVSPIYQEITKNELGVFWAFTPFLYLLCGSAISPICKWLAKNTFFPFDDSDDDIATPISVFLWLGILPLGILALLFKAAFAIILPSRKN